MQCTGRYFAPFLGRPQHCLGPEGFPQVQLLENQSTSPSRYEKRHQPVIAYKSFVVFIETQVLDPIQTRRRENV